MTVLISPGVDVQIIDESFYASAGAGTIPLIVIATASDKTLPSGSGIAPYTQASNAGKLFLATSQRELLQNYGNPEFVTQDGTPIHGHELNEYGLHAAYQYLGIANRAYVLRADIDIAQLAAAVTPPVGPPIGGTYWLDLGETRWGIFQSNGNRIAGAAWESQPVKMAMDPDVIVDGSGNKVPKPVFGNDGDYAIAVTSSDNRIYEKINGDWYEVGSASWKAARPTTVRGTPMTGVVLGGTSFIVNGTEIFFGSDTPLAGVVTEINNANITNVFADIGNAALVIKNLAGDNLVISNGTGTPLVTLGITPGTYKGVEVFRSNDASYPAGSVAGDVWVKGSSPNRGASVVMKRYSSAAQQWQTLTAPFYPYNSSYPDGNSLKDAAALTAMGVPTLGTIYMAYDAAAGVQVLRRWSGARWEDLVYEASFDAPHTPPVEGALWYNPDFRCDIMVGDGTKWVGYRRRFPDTDPMGVIIAGSMPETQSDGTALVEHDLWLDSSDLENYPALYRWDNSALRWRRIDTTDQTTPFGIVFEDTRENSGTEFDGMPNAGAYAYRSERMADMLVSDFVEPDAPDPRTYPDGMLLFNTRYSTYNVKVWQPFHFFDGGFDPNTDFTVEGYTIGSPSYAFPPLEAAGRWVTASGNKVDGSPYMGRKAQRIMIVRAMSAALQSNSDLRSELVYFNLIASPGYPEMIDEMILLNTDQKEISFIVADTPARLKPMASEIEGWAKNRNLAASNGEEGLTSANIYTAVYYPWGLSTNVDGMEVMVPPSTIALRTMAYNDQVAYPWFAPAGFQRGLVTNATTVGYLTDEGEFKPVLLNQGQRDTLYENKINPIAFIPGRGLVIYGQKTLSPLVSALDRVNVARLANYLKYNLDIVMKPFLFEPNDQQTRDTAKLTVERFLTGIVGLRGITDFAVICDTTNNTPERIDRNELWLDVLIQPTRAVEFIYVPVRIRNTGSLMTNTGVSQSGGTTTA